MYKQPTIYKSGSVYNLDGGSGSLDNFEVPKQLAIVGDEVYAASNGTVHYIRTSTLDTASIPEGWEYVGTVALRDREKLTIIYKTENTSIQWASMWLFKVNGLKLDGTDTFVLQQGPKSGSTPVEIGTFTASESATDLDTLVSELDTWLRANSTAAGALENYNWHAEKHADADGVDSCFIVVDNMNVQSRFSPIKSSTSGATSQLYMWDWCGFMTDFSSIVRNDGVLTSYVVWNKDRFKQNNTSVGSPTDSLTTTGLFNEAGFNATTVVKGYYGTYDNYLDNMVPNEEATTGAYAMFKGKGKEVAEVVTDIVFPNFSGTSTKVFSAELWAASQKAHSTASVEGLNAGDFSLPSIDTEYKILSMMLVNGKDVVNSARVKAGLSSLSLSVSRWSVARRANSGPWFCYQSGIFDSNSMNYANRAIAVAEIDL